MLKVILDMLNQRRSMNVLISWHTWMTTNMTGKVHLLVGLVLLKGGKMDENCPKIIGVLGIL